MRGLSIFRKVRLGNCLAILTLVLGLGGCAVSPEIGSLADRGTSGHSVVVDLREQKAILYKGTRVVGLTPISTGKEGYGTPAGKYAVLAKDIDHRSSFYGSFVKNGVVVKSGVDSRKQKPPPGAKFVGAPMFYYLQIAPTYGLHEGYLPGYRASHGCIRLPARWAKRFYHACQVGTPVVIKR